MKRRFYGRPGIWLLIGGAVCAVTAMRAFLQLRSNEPKTAPLFTFSDGKVLRRRHLTVFLRAFMVKIGEASGEFAGHSFRIGGATDLALAGVPDHEIQAAGRWTSEAFKRYMRFTDEQHARRAVVMANSVR